MFTKIFGSKNQREIKRLNKVVIKINALEPAMEKLADADLQALTAKFKERYAQGESLDDILPEAFALVREASKRILKMRHFDVQLIGGMVLHAGDIAEMKTGEGKTLVATLPAYLHGLSGLGVHLITVNDYLATRDAAWMAPLYEFLGLSVGAVVPNQSSEVKRSAYSADITYGTNNEFGFDYLRDNMAFRLEDRYQRDLNFAIVDEVDSILIDEARTPLIISGAVKDSSKRYLEINALVPTLKKADKPQEKSQLERRIEDDEVADGDFIIDEKMRQVELTDLGHENIERALVQKGLLQEGDNLYAATNLTLLHQLQSALRAHYLFHKNVEYLVQDGQVVLVDEHTGRSMPGRRLSEGLHQALEAKEGVKIQSESQTLASTTFQNYFRLYNNLSGMTGTADTEAFEFRQIYGLDVVVIPTNKPLLRKDANDLIYLSTEEKFESIVSDIEEFSKKGAPVLVGTASIETSEILSNFLQKCKIKHNVLNAKFHEKEADIIAQAGKPGAVTIATNMAGRGTDIVLGGKWESEVAALTDPTEQQIKDIKTDWEERNKQVLASGGLHIIGTERHESRRIDNQLRGRSGRQGDPGYSRFYLSMEDNLLRIFASAKVGNLMRKMGMEHGEAIEAKLVNSSIEKAQRKVEGRNFDIRKQLLEYDDVANDQRQIIYQRRRELMEEEDISEVINNMREGVVNGFISGYLPPQSIEEQWDIPGLEQSLRAEFDVNLPLQQWLDEDKTLYEETLREKILTAIVDDYEIKSADVGDSMRTFEKQITLQVLDGLWKDHLSQMDSLRQGIGLRGYGGKNPKQEYKKESFELFNGLLENIQTDVIKFLSHVKIKQDDEADAIAQQRQAELAKEKTTLLHTESNSFAPPKEQDNTQKTTTKEQEAQLKTPYTRQDIKVGRNEPCPCGSGKKYKQCHGKLGVS